MVLDQETLKNAAELSDSLMQMMVTQATLQEATLSQSLATLRQDAEELEESRARHPPMEKRPSRSSLARTESINSFSTFDTAPSKVGVSKLVASTQSPLSFLLERVRAHVPNNCTPKTNSAQQMKDVFVKVTPEQKQSYDSEIVAAVHREDIYTLKLWHDCGRPLQTANGFDETLLHVASRRGLFDVVEFLVEDAKVSPWVMDKQGVTPWHLAFRNPTPQHAFLDFLLKHDADLLYVTDDRGYTPLEFAPKDTWDEWRTYMESKDIQQFVPKRKAFFTVNGDLPKKNTRELKNPQAQQQQQQQQQQQLDRIDEVASDKEERDSGESQRSSTTSSAQETDMMEQHKPSAGSTERLKQQLANLMLASLNQGLSSSSSSSSPSAAGATSESAEEVTLLEGLSAMDPDVLVNTLRVKNRLAEHIETFSRLEEQFHREEMGLQELAHEFESKKANLDDAIFAVQNAAEETRMTENQMSVAEAKYRAAQEAYQEWKEAYQSARATHKVSSTLTRNSICSTITMDSVTEETQSPRSRAATPSSPRAFLVRGQEPTTSAVIQEGQEEQEDSATQQEEDG